MTGPVPIDHSALQFFLDDYGAGTVHSCHGIPSLSDSRNFLVAAEHGNYVLTMFGATVAGEIALIPDLTDYLARQQLPCPRPLRNSLGERIGILHKTPATLSERVRGSLQTSPEPLHCAAAGAMLARLHVVGRSFSPQLPEDHRPHVWRDAAHRVRDRLGRDDAKLLDSELGFQALYRFSDLPHGIIHGDLVRDHVLFDDGRISSVVGVPHFRADVLLYDLALAVNDWCSCTDGAMDEHLARASLEAYHAQRPLGALERGAWPVLLRTAALHSWLSGLYDTYVPRPGWGAFGRDSEVSRRILLDRIDNESMVREVWPGGSQSTEHR